MTEPQVREAAGPKRMLRDHGTTARRTRRTVSLAGACALIAVTAALQVRGEGPAGDAERVAAAEQADPGDPAQPLPAEEGTVRVAWFYKPPADSDLQTVAANHDVFILTRNDEEERDALARLGADGPFLQYLLANEIEDPGGSTNQPRRNQVAWDIGDFDRISADHPDWFLLDENGDRIHDGHSYVMDPANPEWQAFWIQRAGWAQRTLGWDGLFLDNIEASLDKRARKAALPAAYPTPEDYVGAVESFLSAVRAAFPDRPIWANLVDWNGDYAILDRYAPHLDGAMDEGFAVDWDTGYRTPEEWERSLRRAEHLQAHGLAVLTVAQGARDDLDRQRFALASHLLIADARSSFRYARADAYAEAWTYANLDLSLGPPSGPRYAEGDRWRRDFAHGTVIVNPITQTASITTAR